MNEQPFPLVACPYCSSTETELASLFGQQLLTVLYYCRSCSTPFERVKGDDVVADAARFIERGHPST